MLYKNFGLLFVLCFSLLFLVTSEEPAGPTCQCNSKLITDCDCSNQKLQAIPATIKEGVKNLVLSHNEIHTVGIIPETESLEKLDLSNNQVVKIEYNAFDNLDYLKVLILSNNNLTTIGDDIFEWNPLELRVIHLDNNKLEFVQHFLFYDLDQLFEIDLSSNKIVFVHPHAFGQLKTLVTLKLANNKLHTLDPRWFNALSSDYLQYLDLSNNTWSCDCAMKKRIDALKKKDFVRKYLETLKCKRGDKVGENILGVDPAEFTTCDKPTITQISSDASVHKGQTLKLHCGIDKKKSPVASIMWRAPNGDTYNYHNADKFDGIEAHTDGALVITGFRKADAGVYNCVATSDAGNIEASTSITYIDTDATDGQIDANVGNTTNPDAKSDDTFTRDVCPEGCKCLSRHTDCAIGTLKEIPSKINTDSRGLNVASNELTRIPAGKLNLPDLTELRFDENQISEVEDHAFDFVPQLQTLSLRENKLKTLPAKIFANLQHLDKLLLDNNELEILDPNVFFGLDKLAWLYIRNNKLTEIKVGTFNPAPILEYIHLENNRISQFPLEIVEELTGEKRQENQNLLGIKQYVSVKRIFVDQNDFSCDCHSQPLYNYLATHKDQYKYLFGDGISCAYPNNLIGSFLMELQESQLVCTTVVNSTTQPVHSSTMTGLWFGGMILGIVLCIAFIFFFKRSGRKCLPRKRTNYASLTAQDSDYLVGGGSTGGGSEAFV